MGIAMAALMPHPPIIIPEVGKRNVETVSRTQKAMRDLAGRINAISPEVLVMITPHGPVFRDRVAVLDAERFEGDLGAFGASSVRFSYSGDRALARAIYEEASARGVKVVRLSSDLDHGVMVPLYYLREAGIRCPLALLTFALLPVPRLYTLGQAIESAVTKLGRCAVLIASGDLSHRLTPDAPAGFDPVGKVFDAQIVDAIKKGNFEGILSADQDLVERAGECGYRPLVMLLGALSNLGRIKTEVLSYEGPFGVGYAVASFEIEGQGQKHGGDCTGSRCDASPTSAMTRLAKEALEAYVRERRVIEPPDPLPPEMRGRAGVFVSLKMEGELRGCIGTYRPVTENIATEIIRNAIEAGTMDPRFPPVSKGELEKLVYSVDVLTEPEPVHDIEELDPKRYGVIVKKGYATGLLLPDLEGVDTVEKQLEIAKMKAGINPKDTRVNIYKFEVKRYH
ncbi:MAG TPA: AmmeMemoRadiSam system protein A [Clostridia bacterium]|nr:AmmeMemoRadiSam system protein A [Clostridia bacterium]